MKFRSVAGAGLFVFSLVWAPRAEAATYIQAATGYPYVSLVDWDDLHVQPWFEIVDGRSVRIKQPSCCQTVQLFWVTPVPVDQTNTNWSSKPYATISSSVSDFDHYLCSFTSTGLFSNCGAQADPGGTSTVLVPTEGTAYGWTLLGSRCIAGGFCGVGATFHATRVTD